ncbi:exo-beta-N-acetylmuramidase NamZ domain-containing protein [Metabacillus herbersteinensis]|uniref:Exo-beta-N-acetylmuramidase NamZ domain-containing protein n=1 Tax=Metabacillus herbersteinensis TaxID=283816 RepID=A0ABV6G9L6_9BACI
MLMIIFMIALSTISSGGEVSADKEKNKNKVTPGVEVLLGDQKELLKGKKVGLITNPTGIDSGLRSIVDLFNDDPDIELTALYGPEHGVRGDAQAGAGVEFYIDEKTGLPVYSLYGKTKKPTPEMLKNVDILVFDIQDVGTRYYTYIYTMAYAMEAAKENNIPFIVLDRPNPQGGLSVDGPVLDPEFSSFVGLYPIPLKHGMTVGELASFFNKEFKIGADLEVVKMKGWKRSMDFDDTGLPFVLASPNMPTVSTTFVYPATGLIEGTNVSEGRGTTKPFELIGAPYINSTDLSEKLNELNLPGVKFRAASFTPTFSKHAGKLSHGVEIYVTDRDKFEAVPTGLHIIKTIHDMYPNDFQFLAANNFSLLVGNDWVRTMILEGASVSEIISEYQTELNDFKKVRKGYLMYK